MRGIHAARSPYVLLLNNDTEVDTDFLEEMLAAIRRHKKAFSCQARMIQLHDRDKMDDAGNYYSALGWAYARGKGKGYPFLIKNSGYFPPALAQPFTVRRSSNKSDILMKEHFAYLEDIDVGYRARIFGYQNWYVPTALVYHVGSGTSGSRYNQFKTRYSSRNNIYLIYKNMPFLQIILNLPFLLVGFGAKILFFSSKGFGREYVAGIIKMASRSAGRT